MWIQSYPSVELTPHLWVPQRISYEMIRYSAAAGLGPPGVLGQPEGSTSSQGASEPQPDWHGVVILDVSKAAAGPGNRVRWTGARTAGLC